jgi:hypothetical protein
MCIPNRQLNPKARRNRAIANASLVAGLLLWNSVRWNWIHPSSQIELNYLDAMCGLLMGISIGINLFVLRSARRCGADTSGKP